MPTEIIKPSNFSECESCPVANKIIDSWLNFKPSLPHVLFQVSSITIACSITNQTVELLDQVTCKAQFISGRQTLEIPGGNNGKEEVVDCPHFASTSGR